MLFFACEGFVIGKKSLVQAAKQKDGNSFVLRLWFEPSGDDSPEWRWQVQHVQSGEQRYFRNLSAMLDFVAESTGLEPPTIVTHTAEH